MRGPNRKLSQLIRDGLYQVRDPEKSLSMEAYMKSQIPFLGVRKPTLNKIIKPLLKEYPISHPEVWRATIWELFSKARYREEWHAALAVFGYRKYCSWLDLEAVPLCEKIIVKGAWWDVVDDIATQKISPILSGERGKLTPVLTKWATDENLWKRRTSILAQLKHKEDTDRDLLSYVIEKNLEEEEFFLRKSIGWALREYARTSPKWVVGFVEQHQETISGLSRREALKHIWKRQEALHLK